MSRELEAGYAACEVETRRVALNFGLGIRLLPAPRRKALSAVYWFSHRADEAVDGLGPPARRRDRLDAIRDALEASLAGDPPDARWAAVADAARRYRVPPRLFHELLDGVARDLAPVRYPDWESLRTYCHGVAGVVGLIGLRIFGGEGEAAERSAVELGYALQLTNILRDVREDALAGRWYLPEDECARFGVSPAAVAAGRAEPGFEALVGHQAERARRLFGAADEIVRRLPRSTRACPAALAGVYRGLLDRIAVDPGAPLRGRVSLSSTEKVARGFGAALRSLWLRPTA